MKFSVLKLAGRPALGLTLVLLCLLCVPGRASAAVQATMTTLLTNGPAGNRLNVVILSEGYMTNQLGQFLVDATNAINVLLNKAPFQEYRSYINAFAISVPSNQSGSDHPNSGLYKDTYFNSAYDSFSDFYITIPPNEFDSNASHGQAKVDALVQQFMPECGLSVLLVNDISPGGSDGFDLTAIFSAGHMAFLPHETGHVLAALGDEYALEYPGYPDTEEPNTTRETRRDFIKWKAWIATNTPLPTPTSYPNAIGLFEGAHYHDTGWYRPKLDCTMRSPDSDFCEVCSEALVLAIYDKVRPIDAFAPAGTNLTLSVPETVTFSVVLPQPLTHGLVVQWFTNDTPILTATALTLSSASLKPGLNTVRALVSDPTTLVRKDPSNRLSQVVTWSLNVQSRPTIDVSCYGTSIIISGTGGTPGTTCSVLSAPTLTWPVANWIPVRTNVFDATGSFRYTNTIAPTMPGAFYRLRSP